MPWSSERLAVVREDGDQGVLVHSQTPDLIQEVPDPGIHEANHGAVQRKHLPHLLGIQIALAVAGHGADVAHRPSLRNQGPLASGSSRAGPRARAGRSYRPTGNRFSLRGCALSQSTADCITRGVKWSSSVRQECRLAR